MCADLPGTPLGNALDVRIAGESVEFHPQTGTSAAVTGCAEIIPEPLHKGEIVLYRYKDMAVEFHDGKVTDVK
jgi:hypothetical protein